MYSTTIKTMIMNQLIINNNINNAIIESFLNKGSELKPLTNQQIYKLNNLSHLKN